LPKINKVELNIAKSAQNMKSLRIAMASDIHLGTIVSNSRLEKFVNAINDINPDIILLAGDIVDEDIAPVIENNLGELRIKLKSKYGTYAVTGNHEYIGGVKEAVDYLTAHKINMLSDQTIKIADAFYIAGREDRTIRQYSGKMRKSLNDILSGIDRKLPVILIDHQPFSLHVASEAGVDLQLSGHTHHGQLWPFNFLTSAIYELSYGYLHKGKTHFYVSSGYGTWGPPVRTSARPEIVDVTLHFGK
jgi:predicted MPP superfamily phosphohydrolase